MKFHIERRSAAKAASLMLAAGLLSAGILAAGSLAGCGRAADNGSMADSAQTDGTSDGGGAGNKNAGSGNGESPGSGDTAKGRYMEEEIALPEEAAGMTLLDGLQREDRSLEIYLEDNELEVFCYTYGKDGWNRRDVPFDIPEGLRTNRVMRSGEGKYYIGGYDQNYVYRVYTDGEDGAAKEMFADVFRVPEGEEFGLLPDYVAILPGEALLVSDRDEAAVYTAQGKERIAVPQDFIGMDQRVAACATEDSYITVLNGQLVRYDIETGQKVGTYALSEQIKKNVQGTAIFTLEAGGVCIAGPAGLYHTGENGTIWEQLIDGGLNSMGRQDIFVKRFYQGSDNDYYGLYYADGGTKMLLLHFYYDETVDTVPPKTLTIYALRDSSTVRQAAAVMQKVNPEVRIDFRIAVENSEEKITEDVIRALNTELLNGKGADVLILDGLPAESYRRKGILADLSGVLEGIKADLLPNLAGGFTAEDGGIYYLPARITVPVIFGEPQAMEALTSLDGIAAYTGEPNLLAADIYENVLRMTARTCYTELFHEDGTVGGDTLKKWLEAVKTAGDRAGLKVEYTPEEAERLMVSNRVIDGFGRQSDFRLASGYIPVAVDMLTSIDSAMLPISAAELGHYEIRNIDKTYVPSVMAGINASTVLKDEAEEFVNILLGGGVQDRMLWDGFSVRTDSLEKWGEEEKNAAVAVGTQGIDFTLEGGWPSKEWREEILSLVRTADRPILIDSSILDMITAGSRDYLDGKESVEGAVQAIENQIRLYTAERE